MMFSSASRARAYARLAKFSVACHQSSPGWPRRFRGTEITRGANPYIEGRIEHVDQRGGDRLPGRAGLEPAEVNQIGDTVSIQSQADQNRPLSAPLTRSAHPFCRC
jgi:hypothetical protein